MHWPISTRDKGVQALFDRGMMMLYAFDIGEARLLFARAAATNPCQPMGYWGMAEAETFDINVPPTPASERRGAREIALAKKCRGGATPAERALTEALTRRYALGSLDAKTKRYASAMRALAEQRRPDSNTLVVAAFARYDALDSVVDARGAMVRSARAVLADLDRALRLDPSNVGAHHLRIHLLEEAGRAHEAVSDATALESYAYASGESHLLHMPAHVWSRLGLYDRLVTDNLRACANDRVFFALGDGPGQRYMRRYHDHDVDFVLYGLTAVGRNAAALRFAAGEDRNEKIKLALRLHEDERVERFVADSQFAALALALAATRLGHADAPVERQRFARWGVRNLADADESLRSAGLAVLDAAAATRKREYTQAVADYRRAYDATKNAYPGDPRDFWPFPLGEGYGAALLRARRPAAAERIFRAELRRFPNDPHLEWGLAKALTAQGRDAGTAHARYEHLWKGSRSLTLGDLG